MADFHETVHSFGMAEKDLDAFVVGLKILMDRRKLKPAPLSTASGLGIDIIRDLIRKGSSPKLSTARAIAQTVGLSVDEIVALGGGDNQFLRPIAVAGTVGAGARVPLVDAYEKGEGLYHVACPPQLARSSVVAVEVAGDSMEPVYYPGDVLFFTRDAIGVPDDAIGHNCIVEDADGMAWVKRLRRGDEPGLFNLIALNDRAETQHNVPIRWAARVRFALPAEDVERVD